MNKKLWFKVLAVAMALCMVLSFAACTPETPEQTTEDPKQSSETESTKPQESGSSETDPIETDPIETDPIETDPIETDPIETDPIVTDPIETDPIETDPIETDPIVTDPIETDPIETDPIGTDPVETDPVETDPIETDPVETDPIETDPVETDPIETDPACEHELSDNSDEENHWQECDLCGEKFDVEPHDWSEDWEKNAARHWKECSVCGEIKDSADHTPGDDYAGDATQHWKECTVCETAIDKEDHIGNLVDNNDGTHSKVCTTCISAYEDAVAHTFGYGALGEYHKCECGATEVCENGPFDLASDATGHWYENSCEICGVTSGLQEHEWEYTPKTRTCKACLYSETCDKNHYNYSEGLEGVHWFIEDCEICNITAGDETTGVAHNFGDPINSTTTCIDCGYKYICPGGHLEAEESGHKIIEACWICQITEDMITSDIVPHDTNEDGSPAQALWITETGTSKIYGISCPSCGYAYSSREISNDVNYYSAPFQLVNRWGTSDVESDGSAPNNANGTGDGKVYRTDVRIDEDGTSYTRVHLHNYGEVYFTNGTAPLGDHDEYSTIDKIEGGVGRFAVLKVRFSKNGTWAFKFTTDTGKTKSINKWVVPNKSGWAGLEGSTLVTPEFGILVIDLEALGVSDPEATAIRAMFRLVGNADAGQYVDIAYFAVCDNVEEISNVVGNETEILHYTAWANDDEVGVNIGGGCVSGCKATRTAEDNIVYLDDGSDVCYTYDLVTYKCGNPVCANYYVEDSRLEGQEKGHDVDKQANDLTFGESEYGNCWSANSKDTCKREECSYVTEGMTGGDHILGATVVTPGENGTVYSIPCTNEGCPHKLEILVPEGVNYFSAPGQIVNNWGSCNVPGTSLSGTKTELTTVMEEDGVVFTRVYNSTWATFYLANGSVAATDHVTDTANVDKLTGGMGKYLVIKGRSATGTNTTFRLETNTGKALSPQNPKWFGTYWSTYVIDISTLEDASAATIKTYMQISGGCAYVDIAYMAICNTPEQVGALVGTDGTVTEGTTILQALSFSKVAAWGNGDANPDYELKYANWDEMYSTHFKPAETPAE